MSSTEALLDPLDRLMTITSDLLGPLEIQQDEILHFPKGLIGLPDCRSFVLIGAERDGLYWLQSTEYPTLTFLVIDPFLFFEGYGVEMSNAEVGELGAHDSADVSILAIVTLPSAAGERPTANLQGPIAINNHTRTARQLVLQDAEFGTRCPFDLE